MLKVNKLAVNNSSLAYKSEPYMQTRIYWVHIQFKSIRKVIEAFRNSFREYLIFIHLALLRTQRFLFREIFLRMEKSFGTIINVQ